MACSRIWVLSWNTKHRNSKSINQESFAKYNLHYWNELTLKSDSQKKDGVLLDTVASHKIWLLNWNMKHRNSKNQGIKSRFHRVVFKSRFQSFSRVVFIALIYLLGWTFFFLSPCRNNSPIYFNPFVPNAPFLYPLKTSENRKVFWCFQG